MVPQRHLLIISFGKESRPKKAILEKYQKELTDERCLSCVIDAELDHDQLTCTYVKDEIWSPLQAEIDALLIDNQDERESTSLTDRLHEVANSLPFTGSLIDIVIEFGQSNIEFDSHLTLWGALRRLKDWHNANLIILISDNEESQHFVDGPHFRKLTAFIGANVATSLKEISFCCSLYWRGKVSIVDKTVNKGFILPGFSLISDDVKSIQKSGLCYPKVNGEKQDHGYSVVLGRMLEVLDEVDVQSVPSFMFTSHRCYLSLYNKHPHSESLIEHIMCSEGTGVLMRLACYPEKSDIPSCGDKYLNTSSWKESIMADITYVQEPEEELQEKCEFLYFLVTNNSSNNNNDQLTVHQLRSSYEINGSVVYNLYHHSLLPRMDDGQDIDVSDFLKTLPQLTEELLDLIHKDLEDIQSTLLQEWAEKQILQGETTEVRLSDIYSFLSDVQEIFLKNVMQRLPKTNLDEIKGWETASDLDLNPADWPERKYLIYQESQKRALSRLQSTESMALSSPIQPTDIKKTIDVQDFLKMFKSDGTATQENLSPVRKRHPSRTQARIVDQDHQDVVKSSWPDSVDLCRYPDVYYNRGKKREKFETHFNKLRDRYVTAETYSSCSSPKVVFPNNIKSTKHKQQLSDKSQKKHPRLLSPRRSPRKSVSKGSMLSPRRSPRKSVTRTTMLSPRRSPRKRVSKQFQNNEGVSARNMRLSDSLQLALPKHLLQNDESKRRHSLSSIPTNKTKTHADTGLQDTRRLSLSMADQNGKRKASESSDLNDSLSKKVSRSERHKRRLEEICSDVLLSKGVDKDNPIYSACTSKLYKVTKLFVMDLPTSRNLKDEMKKIATDQVQHVIDVETRRQSTVSDGGGPNKRQRKN